MKLMGPNGTFITVKVSRTNFMSTLGNDTAKLNYNMAGDPCGANIRSVAGGNRASWLWCACRRVAHCGTLRLACRAAMCAARRGRARGRIFVGRGVIVMHMGACGRVVHQCVSSRRPLASWSVGCIIVERR